MLADIYICFLLDIERNVLKSPTMIIYLFIFSARSLLRDTFSGYLLSSVQFSRSVMSDSLRPHRLLPCPLPTPEPCSNSCPSSQWCHLTISSSVIHFSFCFQSFSASGSFPMSRFFASGGQSIRDSSSVLTMNIQGWFSLGLTGLISLQSMVLWRVFSSTQFESINSLALSLLYGPTLISVHDYWKTHSFDYMNFCKQSDVSAF